VLPIYDALFQQNAIRHILVRHEQAAVHAARATRAPPARWAWCWSRPGRGRPTPSRAWWTR
jgi:glyoxylate carboligase